MSPTPSAPSIHVAWCPARRRPETVGVIGAEKASPENVPPAISAVSAAANAIRHGDASAATVSAETLRRRCFSTPTRSAPSAFAAIATVTPDRDGARAGATHRHATTFDVPSSRDPGSAATRAVPILAQAPPNARGSFSSPNAPRAETSTVAPPSAATVFGKTRVTAGGSASARDRDAAPNAAAGRVSVSASPAPAFERDSPSFLGLGRSGCAASSVATTQTGAGS